MLQVIFETELETLKSVYNQIIEDDLYLLGLGWGTTRPGHDEGSIRNHIAELENNLSLIWEKGHLSEIEWWKLRILIHVHDIRKIHAKPGVSIDDPYSHASLAKDLLAQYIDDQDLLNMIQFHDEGFAIYRQFKKKGTYKKERFDNLIANIKDWRIFIMFNIIDNCTEGKSREPLKWFIDEIARKIDVPTKELFSL